MTSSPQRPHQLPPEALALATRLFDAARNGDVEILGQALDAGLKPNMTNGRGDSLVSAYAFLLSYLSFYLGDFRFSFRGRGPRARCAVVLDFDAQPRQLFPLL